MRLLPVWTSTIREAETVLTLSSECNKIGEAETMLTLRTKCDKIRKVEMLLTLRSECGKTQAEILSQITTCLGRNQTAAAARR